ncbi:MAG TPA: alpha/beta fold hydrolase [Anaerolineales bacterium]|nr:alpha/beta fold hydrolase [Anaerolineales bacterium]
MRIKNIFVLIHSPLVGPLTWNLVAQEMRSRGQDVLVPVLEDSPASGTPYWKQHVESVSRSLACLSDSTPVTLVGHSGAGPLLPVIRQSITNRIKAYIFVDAGIPRAEASRLDLMKSEDPEWAAEFEAELKQGITFPDWSFDDLQEVLPDESVRRQMISELRPRGLTFFTEPIPVFEGWPDAPCIYIQFSQAYDQPAAQAMEKGWIVESLKAGHFHMLVDPGVVTDRIINSLDRIR